MRRSVGSKMMKLVYFLLAKEIFSFPISLSNYTLKVSNNTNIQNGLIVHIHLDLFNLLEEIHKFNSTSIHISNEIDDDSIDINILGSFQNAKLSKNSSYLTTTYKLRTFFIFRNPNQKNLGFNLISAPFKPKLWGALLIMSLLMITVLRFSIWRDEHIYENRWISSIYSTISVLYCQQESSWVPTSIISKFIFTSILLASILIFNYYTSIMLALLLNFNPPIYRDIDEFNQSPLEKGLCDCNWLKLWNFQELDQNFQSNFSKFKFYQSEVALQKVNDGGFAYYGDFGTIYSITGSKFNQNSLCELLEFNILSDFPIAFTVRKNWPLKEAFQVSLVRFREIGITRRIHKLWEPPKPECYSYSKWIPLNLHDVKIGFYCLFAGIIGGLLGFLIELTWLHFC